MMYSVSLYQNMVCPHEADFVRALSARADVRITWVVDTEVLPHRARMGISRPDCGAAEVIVTTDEARIRRIVRDAHPQAIHIMQGPRGGVCSHTAWRQLLADRRRMGLYSEPGDPRGVKGILRRWLNVAERVQWGHRLHFVLATGQLGIDWYARCGYPSRRLFPFCYVTRPADPLDVNGQKSVPGAFRVAYCGQLVQRKSVDALLHALAQLQGRAWTCSIVGDGLLRTPLQRLGMSLGIMDRIDWRGVLANAEAQNVMRASDVIVLPSAFDGWGAVVNEALSVGTPVICSQACGAAEFLREDWRGGVVPVSRIAPLAAALAARMDAGTLTTQQCERIRSWARETIAGKPVAQYFVDLMNHVYKAGPRPVAPWRRPDRASAVVAM